MSSVENIKGKIVLFGKTGEGKSTIANALVTGGIDRIEFPISDGLVGCTSEIRTSSGRGWLVTDTVGLGEASGGTVKDKDAEDIMLKFLKEVKREYSHIVYVKSSTSRFDVMDEQIWKSFIRIFQGAEGAFTILFTKGTKKWLCDNFDSFPQWVKDIGSDNILITDIPPFSNRPKAEQRNKVTRAESAVKLEDNLVRLFQCRGAKYFVPNISKMNDKELQKESQSILSYIMKLVKDYIGPVVSMTTGFMTIFGAL